MNISLKPSVWPMCNINPTNRQRTISLQTERSFTATEIWMDATNISSMSFSKNRNRSYFRKKVLIFLENIKRRSFRELKRRWVSLNHLYLTSLYKKMSENGVARIIKIQILLRSTKHEDLESQGRYVRLGCDTE